MKSSRIAEDVAAYGPQAPSDRELVALITGARISKIPPLVELMRMSIAELQAIPGIGSVKAARLQAALELGKRAAMRQADIIGRFSRTEDVVDYFRPRLASLTQEHLYLVLLNCRNEVFRIEKIAMGGLTGISVGPREIFGPAVREAAAGMILVHNHPSGDPSPSGEDILLTERVASVGAALGIPLLDHVIVVSGGHKSCLG